MNVSPRYAVETVTAEVDGFIVRTTKEHLPRAKQLMQRLVKALIARGCVKEDLSYCPQPAHLRLYDLHFQPYIYEMANPERDERGPLLRPNGTLCIKTSGYGKGYSDTARKSLEDRFERIVNVIIGEQEKLHQGHLELAAKEERRKREAQERAELEARERARREEEIRAWYASQVAKLRNGELSTGVADLDIILRRWVFLPGVMREGIVAMIASVPLENEEKLLQSRHVAQELGLVEPEQSAPPKLPQ